MAALHRSRSPSTSSVLPAVSSHAIFSRCNPTRRPRWVKNCSTPIRPSCVRAKPKPCSTPARSEEHTSELPVTNAHLVCRLLLEKKKKNRKEKIYNKQKL